MARAKKKDDFEINHIQDHLGEDDTAATEPGWMERAKAIELRLAKEEGVYIGEAIPDLAREENRFPTELIALDYILNGGLVKGAGAIEVYGPENVGKSFLAHHTVAKAQERGKTSLWVCAPGEDYDRRLGEASGCHYDKKFPPIVIRRARNSEELIDKMQEEIATGLYDLAVVDSVAALRPKDEISKPMTKNARVAGQPCMVQRFVSKANDALFDAPNTALFLINQVRATQEQVWTPSGYVPADPHPPGGHYFKHLLFADVFCTHGGHILIKRGSKDNIVTVGRVIDFKGIKGKIIGPHGRTISLDVYVADCPEHGFRMGQVNEMKALCDVGLATEVLVRNGAWLSFGSDKWQGAQQFVFAMQDNPEIAAEIRKAIYDSFWRRPVEEVA